MPIGDSWVLLRCFCAWGLCKVPLRRDFPGVNKWRSSPDCLQFWWRHCSGSFPSAGYRFSSGFQISSILRPVITMLHLAEVMQLIQKGKGPVYWETPRKEPVHIQLFHRQIHLFASTSMQKRQPHHSNVKNIYLLVYNILLCPWKQHQSNRSKKYIYRHFNIKGITMQWS